MNQSLNSINQMKPYDTNLLDNHIIFSSCPIIREICAPLLKNYRINHFRYIKINSDGSIATLTTSKDWQKRIVQADYIKYLNVPELWSNTGTSYYLWSSVEDKKIRNVLEDARNNHNITNGLVIVKSYGDYCECYCFATTKDNLEINNKYLNDKMAFERFILYFKDKAEDLIREADKNKIYLPNSPLSKDKCDINSSFFNNDLNNEKEFLSDTPIKNVQLDGQFSHITLTIGEAYCTYLLLKKMTFKQIARILHVSPRTVEARLNNVRGKLNCKNKSELASLVKSTSVLNTLEIISYGLENANA